MAPLEGPVSVGALIDAILLGCAFVQSCLYYKNSRGDSWLLKLLVSLILFFLVTQLGCACAWLWASEQVNTGNTSVPGYATILFGVSSVLGATILFLERCFFSRRILNASNNHLLAFMFFIFCIFSFTAGLGAASVFFVNATANLAGQLSSSWIFPFVIVSGLVCDLAISIATAFYLRLHTPTEMADALGRVDGVLVLIAETNTVISLIDIAMIVVYWLTKENYAWVSLLVLMPGVFVNTLLATLNARGKLCSEVEHRRISSIGEGIIDQRPRRPPIMIAISKKVEKQSENNPV